MSIIYSTAFNELGDVSGEPDVRTGIFSKKITLGKITGSYGLGPHFSFDLQFNPLDTIYDTPNPFGLGWSLSIPSYTYDATSMSGQLLLLDGQNFVMRNAVAGRQVTLDGYLLQNLKVSVPGDESIIVLYSNGDELTFRYYNETGAQIESIKSKNGRSLKFSYFNQGDVQNLTAVTDDTGCTLVKFDYAGANTTVTFSPDCETESYAVVLSTMQSQLNKISFSENQHTANFVYNEKTTGSASILYITEFSDSNGLVEQVSYGSTISMPNGAPVPAMYVVTTYTSSPGSGQPSCTTTYEYGIDSGYKPDLLEHNFLGYGATVTYASNTDSLLNYPAEYYYSNRLTRHIDEKTMIVETYTYDKFHSLLELSSTQDNGAHLKTETAFYLVDEAAGVTSQSPIYTFPQQKTTRYDANGMFREEVRQYEWDEATGQLLKKTDNTGVVTTYTYYPAEGETDGDTVICPADPNGFSTYLKEEIVYPATNLALAPTRHVKYAYDRHPRIDNVDSWYVAIESTSEFDGDGNIYHVRKHEYYDEVTQAFTAGRKKKVTDTYLSTEDESATFDTTTQLTYLQDPTLYQLTTTLETTGFDGTIDKAIKTKSYLSGLTYSKEDVTSTEVHLGISYAYDGLQRIISRTTCPGTNYEAVNRYEYTNAAEGMPRQKITTKANGSKTRQSYDGHGKLIKTEVLDVDSAVSADSTQFYVTSEYLYDALSRKVSATIYDYVFGDMADAPSISACTTYAYDEWSELVTAQVNSDYMVLREHDPVSMTQFTTISVDGVKEQQCQVEYDLFQNRKTQTSFEADGVTPYATNLYAYDGAGRSVSQIDPLQNVTQTSYDFFNRNVQTSRPDGSREVLTYAPHSDRELPTSFRWFDSDDATGIVVGQQEFDGLSRVTVVQVGQRRSQCDYLDNAPEPDTITTPAQNCFRFARQPELGYAVTNNSLSSSSSSDTSDTELTYAYDCKSGALLTSQLQADNGDASLRTFTYSPSGKLSTEQFDCTLEAEITSRKASYSYSLRGAITAWVDVLGNSHKISYSPSGVKESYSINDRLKSSYSYDGSGRLISTETTDSNGNALACALTYDAQGRELSRTLTMPDGIIEELNLSYDLNNQIVSRNWTRSGASLRAEKYSYDSVKRLIDYSCTGSELPDFPDGYKLNALHFEFGICGRLATIDTTMLNPQSQSVSNTMTFTYSSVEPTQLTNISNTLITGWDAVLQYDANGNTIVDERGLQLSYNGRDQLLCQTGGTTSAQLWYDANGKQIAEKRSDDIDPILLYYIGSQLTNEVQGTAGTTWLETQGRLLSGFSDTDSEQLLATDQQGSIVKVSDDGQEITLLYTPYGYCASTSQTLADISPSYTGARQSRSTGYYMLGNGYRGYNPALGRFLAWDNASPFDIGGGNGYAYCSGDPANQTDPSGHGIFKMIRKEIVRLFRIVVKTKKAAGAMETEEAAGTLTQISDFEDNPVVQIVGIVVDHFDPTPSAFEVVGETVGTALEAGIPEGYEEIQRIIGHRGEYRLRKALTPAQELKKMGRGVASTVGKATWKAFSSFAESTEFLSPTNPDNFLRKNAQSMTELLESAGESGEHEQQAALGRKLDMMRSNERRFIEDYSVRGGTTGHEGATNRTHHIPSGRPRNGEPALSQFKPIDSFC